MPFFQRQLQPPIEPDPALLADDPTYAAIIAALLLLQLVIASIGVIVMIVAALREIIPALIRRLICLL